MTSAQDLGELTILNAEDDEAIRLMNRDSVIPGILGYFYGKIKPTIISVGDGTDAIISLLEYEKRPPRSNSLVCVLDYTMPMKDGYSVYEHIMAHQGPLGIASPVIFHTGFLPKMESNGLFLPNDRIVCAGTYRMSGDTDYTYSFTKIIPKAFPMQTVLMTEKPNSIAASLVFVLASMGYKADTHLNQFRPFIEQLGFDFYETTIRSK